MSFVGDNDFSECFADRGVQQASAEVNLQRALYYSFVQRGGDSVLNVFRSRGQRKRCRTPASLSGEIRVHNGLQVSARAGRLCGSDKKQRGARGQNYRKADALGVAFQLQVSWS